MQFAIRNSYFIACKVRLADVVTCPPTMWTEGYGHLIARQHVDFVLCDSATTELRLVIELDDRSHERESRQRRDRFLNEVLKVAGVPLLRVAARSRYDHRHIRQVICERIGKQLA